LGWQIRNGYTCFKSLAISPMRILVTGATGFIGRHVVRNLLDDGYSVLAQTTKLSLHNKGINTNCHFVCFNLEQHVSEEVINELKKCEKVIHLAWAGLGNFKDLRHIEDHLMCQYGFIKRLVSNGLTDITITGTCLEYGLQNGSISVSDKTDPIVSYAIAKDSLRRFLVLLQTIYSFDLKWIRLFYMYGEGQSEKSLLSQLKKALNDGDESFPMSPGDQLRDYLPVEEVAKRVIQISLENRSGEFHCSSNKPISVLNLVKNFLSLEKRNIEIRTHEFPYNDYEPIAFWGSKED
jgi:nucleoside-diphosphate-sugar epimerase